MSKYFLCIFFTIIFIHGCSFSKNYEKNFTKIKNSNFDAAIENIVLDILKSNNIFIFKKTLFFVNLLENKSNIIVDKNYLTNLIKNKISIKNNNIYYLEKNIIDKNKKKLGISNVEKILDTNTAILLSRNNHVKYYLYSCIYGKNEPYLLEMKLILVKTGEIIFIKTEKFYW